jgi:hypothetical protein
MTTYNGPATVTADGTQYEVTAQLTVTPVGHLKEWYGSLQAQDDAAAWNILNASTAILRVAEGRESAFTATGSSAGSNELDIQGGGPAPFGD